MRGVGTVWEQKEETTKHPQVLLSGLLDRHGAEGRLGLVGKERTSARWRFGGAI